LTLFIKETKIEPSSKSLDFLEILINQHLAKFKNFKNACKRSIFWIVFYFTRDSYYISFNIDGKTIISKELNIKPPLLTGINPSAKI